MANSNINCIVIVNGQEDLVNLEKLANSEVTDPSQHEKLAEQLNTTNRESAIDTDSDDDKGFKIPKKNIIVSLSQREQKIDDSNSNCSTNSCSAATDCINLINGRITNTVNSRSYNAESITKYCLTTSVPNSEAVKDENFEKDVAKRKKLKQAELEEQKEEIRQLQLTMEIEQKVVNAMRKDLEEKKANYIARKNELNEIWNLIDYLYDNYFTLN